MQEVNTRAVMAVAAMAMATGGLAPITVPADASAAGQELNTRVALMPLTLNGQRLPVRQAPPRIGQDSADLLQDLGYNPGEIDELIRAGVVGVGRQEGEA